MGKRFADKVDLDEIKGYMTKKTLACYGYEMFDKELVANRLACCFSAKRVPKPLKVSYLSRAVNDDLYILLACFLGGLGIHNFMMGETKKGIFKIVMSFLCGIGAILALIDLIKIAMGTYEVNPDKLI